MKRTWLCVGGIDDGVIRTLEDEQVASGSIAFINLPADITAGVKLDCMVKYHVQVRGGICDGITGGVLTHESVNPVQAYKMLVEQYAKKLDTQPVYEHVKALKFPEQVKQDETP